MRNLGSHPAIRQVARDLGLPNRGNCVDEIAVHALLHVARVIESSPLPVTNLEILKGVLASALSVTIRYIDTDGDIDEIVSCFGNAFPYLAAQLKTDFIRGNSEGLLLALPNPEPWQTKHLAVIDRRGDQVNRANFTVWHELAHLLTAPPQLVFAGFRRSPTKEEISKDPIEQLTDHIAGMIAFYDPLFLPVYKERVGDAPLTFESIERVRLAAAPDASFQSTAMACVRHSDYPTLFLKVEPRLSAKETRQRGSASSQMTLGQLIAMPMPKLRVAVCMKNEAAERTDLEIFKQMRVPSKSILHRVFDGISEVELEARENQDWWETSTEGPLNSLALTVRAVRRGSHVYGLVLPLQ